MSCVTGHIDIPRAVKGEGTSTIRTTPPRKVAARMELRSEFSFATKPSILSIKGVVGRPWTYTGKVGGACDTCHIDIPRAVKGEGKQHRNYHHSPQEGGRQDASSDRHPASPQRLPGLHAKVLSAEPGPTPGKSEDL